VSWTILFFFGGGGDEGRVDDLKRDRVKQEEKEERKREEGVAVGVPSESNEREEKSCRHSREARTHSQTKLTKLLQRRAAATLPIRTRKSEKY
jgi:hypothetical protein